MVCPRCGSNNITTNNKGYGIGKGVVGAILLGPFGLVAGNIGKNDIICTCLDCGHRWELKKQIEQKDTNYHHQEIANKEKQKEIRQERRERVNNSSLGDCCPVCGERLYSDKKYCPNCTADYLPVDKLNDEFNCGRYNIAQQKGECIYKNHCVHSGCSFLNNKINESNPSGCLIAIAVFFGLIIFGGIIDLFSSDSNKSSTPSYHPTQSVQQPIIPEPEENTKQTFTGVLSSTQIDKICKNSLAEVNANSVSNYIKVSSNPSAKKYVYQSKETLYKYSCGFTGKDTFYINGEGWEDIIPRGTLYKGKTSNCVEFDLYDPGFKLTHNFTVCD